MPVNQLRLLALPLPEIAPSVKALIFKRDKFICQFCGFRSEKYQEVVAVDGNSGDIDKMATACFFCHQCFHLDIVSQRQSGVLIWLPEISQAKLNNIARHFFLAGITSALQGVVSVRLGFLLHNEDTSRKKIAQAKLGTSDPGELAQKMRSNGATIDEWEEIMKGLRLLPLDRIIVEEEGLQFNIFPQMMSYWRSENGPFNGERYFHWLKYFDKKMKVLGATFPDAQPIIRTSNTGLAVKLLNDAAVFMNNLGEENLLLKEQMKENVDIFNTTASLLEADPEEQIAGKKVYELAAILLRNAADFFESIGKQNSPLNEQMEQNASVYREVADLITEDPAGYIE
ncbi:MAG: hypothetical protein WCF67_01765 [Chitinophagaceae bacterium]